MGGYRTTVTTEWAEPIVERDSVSAAIWDTDPRALFGSDSHRAVAFDCR